MKFLLFREEEPGGTCPHCKGHLGGGSSSCRTFATEKQALQFFWDATETGSAVMAQQLGMSIRERFTLWRENDDGTLEQLHLKK